jgi:anti-sigma B factor antagonist
VMTAEHGPDVFAVACEHCGDPAGLVTAAGAAWPVMWEVLVARGWSGTADTGGPHWCPRCRRSPIILGQVGYARSWHLPVHLYPMGQAMVVAPRGDLDAAVAEDLRDVLQYCGADRSPIVLDLAEISVIDSRALAVLVRSHQILKRRQRLLYLARPSRFVRAVLHTTGLDHMLPAFATVDAAADAAARAPTIGDPG